METLFEARYISSYYDTIVLGLCFIGITIVKLTNQSHIYNAISQTISFKTQQSQLVDATSNNKSTTFILIGYVLILSILFKHFFSLAPFLSFSIATAFFLIQLLIWTMFQELSLGKNNTVFFLSNRLMTIQSYTIILFIYLVLHQYFIQNQLILLGVTFLCLIINWIKTSNVLSFRFSVFHIILYLCTLEILPMLLFVKWVSNI